MHILVVDDDASIRWVLGVILRSEGFDVEAAVDGLDALQRLNGDNPPAMIILDMMMPRLDGEGLINAVRRDPYLADIPVVIISGHGDAKDKADELGAAGCLVKPIEFDELSRLVRGVASNRCWSHNKPVSRDGGGGD
jgi:two-component system chemotaxis response regulator CheY